MEVVECGLTHRYHYFQADPEQLNILRVKKKHNNNLLYLKPFEWVKTND